MITLCSFISIRPTPHQELKLFEDKDVLDLPKIATQVLKNSSHGSAYWVDFGAEEFC